MIPNVIPRGWGWGVERVFENELKFCFMVSQDCSCMLTSIRGKTNVILESHIMVVQHITGTRT